MDDWKEQNNEQSLNDSHNDSHSYIKEIESQKGFSYLNFHLTNQISPFYSI